ncbi:hypothetical protein RRG08_026695 [Elysia crispata]|uniref:Uncharacterized protein n=1 Tax=Elysia crispata TaxID=231223 RepID=A0AAE1E7J9_9GAST|nr:hypothetical protein RRG08_026695 [Elysia crispata]
MILPDGDDANDVKLIQDKLVHGGFYWDEMSCSLLGGTCQAKLCMPSTLVYNGRCDQGVTPMAFNMRVCLAEVVENDQKCRPLQGKLNVLMHADLKEVLNYVISYTEVFFKMYEAENNSLLESSVSYSEDYGIQISALWRLPFLYDIKPAMVKQSRFDLMSIVESHISTTGWLAVCFRWGTTRMTSTYSIYGNSCELSLSCPPQELAEKDWSSNAASLNKCYRPSLHAANFLWLPGVLLMAL